MRNFVGKIAICHALLAGALLACLAGRRHLLGLLLLGVGYGGLGAAWGRWTAAGGDWLALKGAARAPDRQVVLTAAVHAPALAAGLWLLRQDLEARN